MWRIYSVHNVMFILRRSTGVALLFYFVAHVITISTALVAGPEAFSSVMATFREPAFRAVEWLIVACIAFHALSGLHLMAAERASVRELKARSAPVAGGAHAD
ncbi:MAG TPA: hypothetical protein VEC19_06370 [Usitatibacter sp.]|nr:hypothetical protein [Usitatibacter sp.]